MLQCVARQDRQYSPSSHHPLHNLDYFMLSSPLPPPLKATRCHGSADLGVSRSVTLCVCVTGDQNPLILCHTHSAQPVLHPSQTHTYREKGQSKGNPRLSSQPSLSLSPCARTKSAVTSPSHFRVCGWQWAAKNPVTSDPSRGRIHSQNPWSSPAPCDWGCGARGAAWGWEPQLWTPRQSCWHLPFLRWSGRTAAGPFSEEGPPSPYSERTFTFSFSPRRTAATLRFKTRHSPWRKAVFWHLQHLFLQSPDVFQDSFSTASNQTKTQSHNTSSFT